MYLSLSLVLIYTVRPLIIRPSNLLLAWSLASLLDTKLCLLGWTSFKHQQLGQAAYHLSHPRREGLVLRSKSRLSFTVFRPLIALN